MPKKITKREALTACVKIWRSLAKSGKKNKPETSYKYLAGCPCCEYDEQHHHFCTIDDSCLLNGLWPRLCYCSGSPYLNWQNCKKSSDRKKYAKVIADYTSKLLRKLK